MVKPLLLDLTPPNDEGPTLAQQSAPPRLCPGCGGIELLRGEALCPLCQRLDVELLRALGGLP